MQTAAHDMDDWQGLVFNVRTRGRELECLLTPTTQSSHPLLFPGHEQRSPHSFCRVTNTHIPSPHRQPILETVFFCTGGFSSKKHFPLIFSGSFLYWCAGAGLLCVPFRGPDLSGTRGVECWWELVLVRIERIERLIQLPFWPLFLRKLFAANSKCPRCTSELVEPSPWRLHRLLRLRGSPQ